MSSRYSNYREARYVNCSGGLGYPLILSYIGAGASPGIGPAAFTKPYPTYTPAPPSDFETPLSPPTQPLSPSTPPTDPNQSPLIGLKPGAFFYSLAGITCRYSRISPVDTATDAPERLRSLMELMTEGTRQTDKLIQKMRNVLAEADATNDTTFEARKDEDDAPPAPLTPSLTQIIPNELPPPSSTATLPAPFSHPPPMPFPFNHPDQPSWAPPIRRVRVTSPLLPTARQTDETAGGSPGAPKFDCKVPMFVNFINFVDSTYQ